MTDTTTPDLATRNDPFDAAEQLAPVPTVEAADPKDWIRHHAATALAAFTVFDREIRHNIRTSTPGSRPELGYLTALGVASVHAAVALDVPREIAPRILFDLTPEAGALNGEWEEWLASKLDSLGVNPADIDPEYNAGDFRSPMRAAGLNTAAGEA